MVFTTVCPIGHPSVRQYCTNIQDLRQTVFLAIKRTKVPVDYVTARSSTIFQHFYDVTNSSTEDTSSAEDLHKKLISKVDSHRKSFPFVSNEYSSFK